MYIVTDKNVGIGLMIASLVLLGTWPALICLLERRGKIMAHTFLDYSITNCLVAVIIAMTLGDIGSATDARPNFATQLSQDNGASAGMAIAGGVFLVIGNMAVQYSLAFLGVSLTEVIASSITVVIGTTLNYFLDDRINRAEILFPGVGCFLAAVLVGYWTHHSVKQDTEHKLATMRGDSAAEMELGKVTADQVVGKEMGKTIDMPENAPGVPKSKNLHGTAEYIAQIEGQRSLKVGKAPVAKGLIIVTIAGISYGIFSPAFNLAANDQWNFLEPGVPRLVVYTTFFYFTLGFTFVAWVTNITFLYMPILGAKKSSFMGWIKDNDGRWIALTAGTICGLGNTLQFMAGQAAGYAAADAVQALPLVSTIWGVILFGEYRRSSKKTYILLTCMLLLFAGAVALLCSSAGERTHA